MYLEYVTWAKTLRIQVGTIYMVAWGILTTELVSFFILQSKNGPRKAPKVYKYKVYCNDPSQLQRWTDIILKMIPFLHKI